MVEYNIKVPVAGTVNFTGRFPDGTTPDQAIEIYIANFNATAQNTTAYKQLIQGSIVNFPFFVAEAVKIG